MFAGTCTGVGATPHPCPWCDPVDPGGVGYTGTGTPLPAMLPMPMLIVAGLRTSATFAGRGEDCEYATGPGVPLRPFIFMFVVSLCVELERSRLVDFDEPGLCDLDLGFAWDWVRDRPEARPREFEPDADGDAGEVGTKCVSCTVAARRTLPAGEAVPIKNKYDCQKKH